MSRDSAIATIAIAVFMAAVFALGVSVVADEWGYEINVTVVGGVLITALGFVGLAAVIWQLVQKFLD